MPQTALLLLIACIPTIATAQTAPVLDLTALAAMATLAETTVDAAVVEAKPAGVPAPPGRFTAGSWEAPVYGSVSFGSAPGEIYLAHVGVSYYLVDNFSASLEALGGASLGDATGGAVGFDLLLRWHMLRREGWSLFVDGGAGILYTTTSFETNATHFNFTPQIGVGTTFQMGDDVDLMGGIRWHHISNANIDGPNRNLGHDAPMLYGGIAIRF